MPKPVFATEFHSGITGTVMADQKVAGISQGLAV